MQWLAAEKRKGEFDLVRAKREEEKASDSFGIGGARVGACFASGTIRKGIWSVGFGEMERSAAITREYERCNWPWIGVTGLEGVSACIGERDRYEESLQSTLAVRSARCTCT